MEKKQAFSELVSELVAIGKQFFSTEQNFTDYKTQDGQVVRSDSATLASGSKLQVITPDGVMDIPAEVTELILMIDDVPTKVMIEAGVVKELAPVAEMPNMDDKMPQEMGTDFASDIKGLGERIAALEAALGLANQTMETANKTIADANTKIANQNELNKKLFSIIESYAKEPSVESLTEKKVKLRESNKQNMLDEYRASLYS